MKFPHYLTDGSDIGLIAPAGKTNELVVNTAVKLLTEKGFHVIVGDHALDSHFQMAGTDHNRLSDLQRFLNRQDIDAIFCIRGGYGSIRILEQLDFTHFLDNPKWVVGFSDITNLHSVLQNIYGIASMHALMPVNYREGNTMPDFDLLIQYLKGIFQPINIPTHPLNKNGICEGHLIGGNLSILHSLRGTAMDMKPEGKILFIEDVGEYLYRIDRMMHSLKLGGIFDNIAGMIVGQFTKILDNEEPFGQSAYEIISNAIANYDFPVLFNFPAGHCSPNFPLIFGKTISLEIKNTSCSIKL